MLHGAVGRLVAGSLEHVEVGDVVLQRGAEGLVGLTGRDHVERGGRFGHLTQGGRLVEAERTTLWSSAWIAVARWDDVAGPGHVVTVDVAGDPVVVVRGNDGVVRAFPNVCRHRSATITTGGGMARALQCPYHLWTWALDGTLRAAPERERRSTAPRSG